MISWEGEILNGYKWQGGIWPEYSQPGKIQRGGLYGSEAQIRSKETQHVKKDF